MINKIQGIPLYKVTVPITSDELVLSIRGDFHYGLRGVNLSEMVDVFKAQQDRHRGNLFVVYTGDLIENNLNTSTGHGYDLELKDPHQQKVDMIEALLEVHKHLHGEAKFKRFKRGTSMPLACGVIGNHEYRTRINSGQWLQEELYRPSKILDMRINGLLELTIVNKRLRAQRTFTLFVAHRPSNSNATSIERILTNYKKKKGDIPADIYVYGHVHRRIIEPDITHSDDGKIKKILYISNPSPLNYVEYVQWCGFSPLDAGWFCEVYLPLDNTKQIYGMV